MSILAVIPARGGSKGIPKKNIRLLAGKPLIAYAINTALSSKHISKVIVSTDSQEIAEVASSFGAEIVFRDESLSSDMVTLDPVIYHALGEAEKNNDHFDAVITMQPTSPTLTMETLDAAIEHFLSGGYDTVISVVNRPHLCWGKNGGEVYPLYEKRLNRQELPPQYFETGGFVIARHDAVQPYSRMGAKVSVFEVPERESVDIDDENDWLLVEHAFQRKKIIFRADGYAKLGMGHIYNCLTLAYSMLGHQVLLLTKESAAEGLAKIRESNLPYRTFKDDAELDRIIEDFQPDIWVNDCLNTTAEYIRHLKEQVPRVVTIEDLGAGIDEADAVINALYPKDADRSTVYSGHKYVCLRDEFQIARPKAFSEKVENIIVMFGGTDPSNLNKLVYDGLVAEGGVPGVNIYFITGIGYDYAQNGVVNRPDLNIYIRPNVPQVTKYMKQADLALTSQGRTIFELASMCVPAVVLSQNEREMTHTFASMKHGFINLGLGSRNSFEGIYNTLLWLVNTPVIRRDMYGLMKKCKLRSGLERVKTIILGEQDNE
ncbi:MAG: N-acylneuraminate cytidylyltransferase [Selenomonas ruminantium]|jgi:CMP-N-acetylneuraminic acid synthetase/spore coat polysaccharide biosynthesis predicted glycosyltransferase SpsG|uniref:N-acylneuraminate cytidylyltransferase n=1 Tax=Selenomonas ruminantium TaxID=971 RepID=A0A927WHL9_SELRU|nr:N-acylneuraminate cytidylyltransferase [Selenomonas ruminantium]MBE6084921.1 N-acylneuraminate cytidylyltransferase [Selenomonas ruminantium]